MSRPIDIRAVSPALASAIDWTQARSRREQAMIAFLGGLLIVLVLWFGILRPLLEMRQTAIDRIAAYEAIQTRLASGPVVATGTALPDGPLESVLASQSAGFGITPTGIAPEGDKARVTLTAVRYDALVPWLAALEGSGQIIVEQLRVSRAATEGTVDATMTVRRA